MMVVTVIKHSRVCHTVPLRSSYKQPGACRDLRVWRSEAAVTLWRERVQHSEVF